MRNTNNKKILIVSPTFPPTPGIGGRRWAKFTKYLNRSGNDIRVITFMPDKESKSNWNKDIEEFKDKISYINSGYPKILKNRSPNLLQRIFYHIALLGVRFFDKGYIYDRSIFSKNKLTKEVEKYISLGYKNVVVTCGPFRAAYYIAQLKSKRNDFNLIVDFRDFWTQNKNSFNVEALGNNRFEYEKGLEKFVVNNADVITVVNVEFQEYFESLSNNKETSKTIILNNGFDKEDFIVSESKQKKEDKINLVFAGTFYNNCENLLIELTEALNKLSTIHPHIYKAFSLNFYGKMIDNLVQRIKNIDSINFHGEIPLADVYARIREADATMLFLTESGNYTFSTKFYEYVSQKKPILVFSKQGKTGQYITENKIGMSFYEGEIYESFIELYKKWEIGVLDFNPTFDTNCFSVNYSVEKVILPMLK